MVGLMRSGYIQMGCLGQTQLKGEQLEEWLSLRGMGMIKGGAALW